MTPQIRKRSELTQTGTCRGDVKAPKTEFPDHAKLMPTPLTTNTPHEAPTARACVFEAPSTPGSSEVVRNGGIGNRRRVIGDHGLNLEQLAPRGPRFKQPRTPGGEPLQMDRTTLVGRSEPKDLRGFFDTTIPSRLERQTIVVASGRYRREPANQ